MTLFWNWKEASDQIGDFWNLLAIFFTKVAQMFGGFLGSCEIHCFLSQTAQATFGQLSVKLGLLFISTSGHTVHEPSNQPTNQLAERKICKNFFAKIKFLKSISKFLFWRSAKMIILKKFFSSEKIRAESQSQFFCKSKWWRLSKSFFLRLRIV